MTSTIARTSCTGWRSKGEGAGGEQRYRRGGEQHPARPHRLPSRFQRAQGRAGEAWLRDRGKSRDCPPKGALARHTVAQRADASVSLSTGCFRVYVDFVFHVDGSQIGPEFFGQASLRRAKVLHCELLSRAHTPSLVYRLQRL